ncbi:MAG: hypothetical protein NVS1B10_05420 [Candidatus Saccharimonadales bacterium]
MTNKQKSNRLPLTPPLKVHTNESKNFPSIGMSLPGNGYPQNGTNGGASRAVSSSNISRWQKFKSRITTKRIILGLFLIIFFITAFLGFKFASNAHKLFGGNIFSILTTTKLKGEDVGRVNILLAGNSSDDPGHDGADLTDSIMLVSIDTKTNRAYLLSIPRDLWVDILGSHQKINAAYVVGKNKHFNESGYPYGGMGMLTKIVSQDFGIQINYYALLDYKALQQSVDAVGGLDITVKSQDRRGLYDPSIDYATNGPLVKLTNGLHHLNGQQALNFARARGDDYRSYGFAGSDFDRTEHQRQMLVALKAKAVSAGVLANPTKLSSLSDAIGNNVKTDLNLSEVHRLYDISKKIDNNDIKSLSFNNVNGKNLLASYRSYDGQSALIPQLGIDRYTDIKSFIKRQSSTNPIVQEGATVTVLNSSDKSGLAVQYKSKLQAEDLTVEAIGDGKKRTNTQIVDNSHDKKPATKSLLTKQFGNNITTINSYAGLYNSDFIIELGPDQAATNSSTQTTQ